MYKYICDCGAPWLLPACGNLSILLCITKLLASFLSLSLLYTFLFVIADADIFNWGKKEKKEEWVNDVRFFFRLSSMTGLDGLRPSIFVSVLVGRRNQRFEKKWESLFLVRPWDMNGSTLDHDRSSYSWVSGYGRLNIQAAIASIVQAPSLLQTSACRVELMEVTRDWSVLYLFIYTAIKKRKKKEIRSGSASLYLLCC